MAIAQSPLGRALIEARRAGELLQLSPELVPADVASAILVQTEVMETIGASIAGWKVGYTPDGIPVAAPLYAADVHRPGATLRHGPARKSGIEVEIALVLGEDLPPRGGRLYSREDIIAASRAAIAGIEIVASRFVDPPKPPFLAALADNLGNGAYVQGEEVGDFRHLDLARLRSQLRIDGRKVHDGVGGHPKGDPLAPIIDYANAPCDLLGGLKAGQIITTGSLSGCPFLEGTMSLAAEVEGLGGVELRIAL
jgi:2-keto-4-pentenoate hydratase